MTLEERTEQERAEQTKTLERLEQELEFRGKAEAAAAEAERQRQVLAVDLKDMNQKYERLLQEHNALLDEVLYTRRMIALWVKVCEISGGLPQEEPELTNL